MIAIAGISGFTLVLARQLRQEGESLLALQAEAGACPRRVIRSDTQIIEHPDAPASQPLGETAYIEYSTEILPLLRLRLERVRASGGVDWIRFGAPEVLAPGKIHVLGLWAPWCDACKQLFPRLRELFERRTDWNDPVRFVPIQVLDPSAPDLAFARVRALMPASRVQLADRSSRDEFVDILRAKERRLYRGHLPAVLVVDCNRRVRWAKLGAFKADDFADFERWVEQFVAELGDDASRCARPACGNGRCEPGEFGRCLEDCASSPIVIAEPSPDPLSVAHEPPKTRCPIDCPRCDQAGRCPALWGETTVERPPTKPLRCGDGECVSDETDCCLDCGCPPAHVCREDATGAHVCLPALWEPD